MEDNTTPQSQDVTNDEAQQTPQTNNEPSQRFNDIASQLADQAFEPAEEVSSDIPTDAAPDVPTEPTAQEAQVAAPAAPAEQEPASDEEEDFFDYTPTPASNSVQQLDPKSFVDENGYIDVKGMTEAYNSQLANAVQTATSQALAEVQAQRAEERAWSRAVDKYPELKSDREFRDLVQAARIGQATEAYQRANRITDAAERQQYLASIKVPDPSTVAAKLFKRIGDARQSAIKDATETVRIAETAYVETAETPKAAPNKREQLFTQIRSKDRLEADKASKDLLKSLLFKED